MRRDRRARAAKLGSLRACNRKLLERRKAFDFAGLSVIGRTLRDLSPFLPLFPRDVGSPGVRRVVAGFNTWPGDLTSCVFSSVTIMHEIASFSYTYVGISLHSL